MPNLDLEREYLLRALASGGVDDDTPLYDLRRMFYAKELTNRLIRVSPDDSINDAVSAAVEAGMSAAEPWVIWLESGVYNQQAVLAPGARLVGRDKGSCVIEFHDPLEPDDSAVVYAANDTALSNLTLRNHRSSPPVVCGCGALTGWTALNGTSLQAESSGGVNSIALTSMPAANAAARFAIPGDPVNEGIWFASFKTDADTPAGRYKFVLSSESGGGGTTSEYLLPAMKAGVWYQLRMQLSSINAGSITIATASNPGSASLRVSDIRAGYTCNCAHGVSLENVTGGGITIEDVDFDCEDSLVSASGGVGYSVVLRGCEAETCWTGLRGLVDVTISKSRITYLWRQYAGDTPMMIECERIYMSDCTIRCELPAGYGIADDNIRIVHITAQEGGDSHSIIERSSLVIGCEDEAIALGISAIKVDDGVSVPEVEINGCVISAYSNCTSLTVRHFDFEDCLTGPTVRLRNTTIIEPLSTDQPSYLRLEGADMFITLMDGVTAPAAASGSALIYVDIADGDLKVRFGNGITKTIAADT